MSLDEDDCIENGKCADALPQYFEFVDGKVRVRSESDAIKSSEPVDGASQERV